jgi:hypothetical protein
MINKEFLDRNLSTEIPLRIILINEVFSFIRTITPLEMKERFAILECLDERREKDWSSIAIQNGGVKTTKFFGRKVGEDPWEEISRECKEGGKS